MWHEARKQEKKIRSMMVDHQKRADRRRQFYEKIKMDPAQFVRVYGRQAKLHLEQSVALAAEGPQSMVPWAGDRNTLIDRFDVRAHLDYIPEYTSKDSVELNSEEEEEELQCNYERYRILVQNDCAGVTEEQCLHQLYIDEQFGGMEIKQKEKEKEEEKKKIALSKAAIGFSYDDKSDLIDGKRLTDAGGQDGDDAEESSDDEVDLDLVFDIENLNEEQMVSLNKCSEQFGMRGDLYIEHLYKEREEMEMLKQAKQEEDEKAQFSGRKSRRERRAFKEKKMKLKGSSPPSYASKTQIKSLLLGRESSSSRSRSRSPVPGQGRTTYITSFGGNSDEESAPAVTVQGPQLPSPDYLKKKTVNKSREKTRATKSRSRSKQRSRSRSRSRTDRRRRSSSYDRGRRSSSRDRGRRSPSRDRRRRSSSRDRSRRSHSRSRSSRFERHGRYPAARDNRRRSSERDRLRSRRSRSRKSRSRSRDRGRRSRSRSRDRRNRSPRTRSPPRTSKKMVKSKSRSPLPVREAGAPRVPSPPPLKRYRRESLSSNNSDDDSDSDGAESKSSSTVQKEKRPEVGLPSVGNKEGGAASKGKISAAEKLKRRLQQQLNKSFKADKKAQMEKVEKLEQERLEREEDIRMMALEMRRRAREKAPDSDDDYRASDSPRRRRSRSRSRSNDNSNDFVEQSGDIKPLLSLKLELRDRSDHNGSNKRDDRRRESDERRRPRQYDDTRYRRSDDNRLRDSDSRRRSDDDDTRLRDDRYYGRNERSSDVMRYRSQIDDIDSEASKRLVDY